MAVKNARDVYTRRNEGVSIWVVKSSEITHRVPAERDVLFEPAGVEDLPAPDLLPDAGRSEAS
jgi:phenylacetate-CoA oxygenase PaaH subunit